jgi:hypothetical protein
MHCYNGAVDSQWWQMGPWHAGPTHMHVAGLAWQASNIVSITAGNMHATAHGVRWSVHRACMPTSHPHLSLSACGQETCTCTAQNLQHSHGRCTRMLQ